MSNSALLLCLIIRSAMASPFRKRAFEPSLAIGSSSSSGLKALKLAFDPIDLDILLPNGGRVIISVAESEKLVVASLIKQIQKRIPKDILESLNWQKVFLEDPAGNKLLDGEFVFSRNDLRTLFLQACFIAFVKKLRKKRTVLISVKRS